jgi:hypothetical protein
MEIDGSLLLRSANVTVIATGLPTVVVEVTATGTPITVIPESVSTGICVEEEYKLVVLDEACAEVEDGIRTKVVDEACVEVEDGTRTNVVDEDCVEVEDGTRTKVVDEEEVEEGVNDEVELVEDEVDATLEEVVDPPEILFKNFLIAPANDEPLTVLAADCEASHNMTPPKFASDAIVDRVSSMALIST